MAHPLFRKKSIEAIIADIQKGLSDLLIPRLG